MLHQAVTMELFHLRSSGKPGLAINLGYRHPSELYGIRVAAIGDQFGHPVHYEQNLAVGFEFAFWRNIPVGWFLGRHKTKIDVGLLMNLNTGDVMFFVLADSQELADKWLKVTSGYMDHPREDSEDVMNSFADLARRASVFRALEPLFAL